MQLTLWAWQPPLGKVPEQMDHSSNVLFSVQWKASTQGPSQASHQLLLPPPIQFFFAPQVLQAPSSKQRHPHTPTPQPPKVTAGSPKTSSDQKNNKGPGSSSLSSRGSCPHGGDLLLILSTWCREKENGEKGDSYVLTDQGSSLLKASCFLFFPPALLEI